MLFSSLCRSFIALALIACTAGCYSMHSPTNGQVVCGADANVRFIGYVPGAGRQVQIQHAVAASGPWTLLGTATTGNTAYTYDDVSYYRFDKYFQLSKWSSVAEGGAQLHTFVRARVYVEAGFGTPAHWEMLDTFDVVPPQGTSPLDCMNQRMQGGATSIQANNYCKSDEEPVVEVLAPAQTGCNLCTEVTVAGNVTIDSALSAARYSCTENINGHMTIAATAPEQFGFPALEEIHGNANLDYAYGYLVGGNTVYRRRLISFPVLETIGGDATLYSKRTDGSNKLSPNGLDAVTQVGGDITVTCYDTNPNVFDGLTSFTGNITVQGDFPVGALDVNGNGAFQNLTEVTGDILLRRFFATNGMFMALEQVNGNLTINDLRFYPSQSFVSLQNVTGNFHFLAMKQLGGAWTNAVSVGGELAFTGHTIIDNLSAIPLANAEVNALRIENNAMLDDLTGTTFQVGAGGIFISGNPVLSQCEVNAFLAAQQAGGWTGTATVSGTLPCAR